MPYPEGIETAEQASQHVGMKPGDRVYLVGDCGDNWEGRSVIIPEGQPGVLKDFFVEDSWWRFRVDLVDWPGRPYLTVGLNDASIWSLTKPVPPPPPPPPPPETRYEHLLAGTFDI